MGIVGNYTKSIWLPSATKPVYSEYVVGKKTKPIGSVPTSYYSKHFWETSRGGDEYVWGESSSVASAVVQQLRDGSHPAAISSYTRCREKVYGKVTNGTSASLGAALFELRESLGMIANRLLQLFRGFRALRRGKFAKFARIFGITKHPKVKKRRERWSRPKDASKLWIEYWFGWAPTIGDIYSACEAISKEWGSTRVVASSMVTVPVNYRSIWGSSSNFQDGSLVLRTRMQGEYYISNPNLRLAQQLGLANPLAVIWELTPFSWFADWFGSVGSFISSVSDDFGLSWDNTRMITRYVEGSVSHDIRNSSYHNTFTVNWRAARRTVGPWPLPKIHLKKLDRLSWTRGLTASSLCVLLFSHKLN